jgi:Domain of unknown function (DUF3459)
VLSLLTVLENGSAVETANIGREGALAEDYVHENVANLSADTRSVLNLYHALIELRKATPELVVGSYAPVATTADLLAYRREYEDNALLIVLNLGADPISIGSDTMAFPGEILLSTNLDRIGETVSGGLDLCGDEAWSYDCNDPVLFGMIGVHTVDVASFEQIVQSANAVPTITVGLQHQGVFAPIVGFAVVFRQKVDQVFSLVTGKPNRK